MVRSVPIFCLRRRPLMIDLSRTSGVRVDAPRQTVRAEGGVTWEDFDHVTHAAEMAQRRLERRI